MNGVFSDQSHFDRIREALWHRSRRACVMIGSGFSRCALRARPDASSSPLWSDLAKAFSNKLYPQSHSSDRRVVTLQAEGFPRLAQEFEAAFGRHAMNRLHQDLIRDDDLKPSNMHQRLLRLPWRDVFTTNWDTLLERSSALVAERKYTVVRNKDEVPLADGPRIIKLHGSFPAHFPLICTEEDYRTYPIRFAPFVNTVQQAMMETIFCLIGFSGDDPNFLHWSGWVRDNLGASAPKIYLAGWLNLAPHLRRMLEEYNVVPIDLARHPKADIWPEHRRHDYATNWILHTLERGRPYDVIDWPEKRRWSYEAIPDELQPVVELEVEEPKDEWLTESTADSDSASEKAKQILDAWTHNRRLYPGWLAVPSRVRSGISTNTSEYEPRILQALPDLTPIQKLNAIRELVWRREIIPSPISSELESAAENIIQQINCENRTIDGVTDVLVEWGHIRKSWTAVALTLVTAARHRFDHSAFKSRIEALSAFRNDDPEINQRIHNEDCLWAVHSMDFDKLSKLLEDWPTENCDPVWMVRKAAILYEMNRTDNAVELFDRALLAIREIPDDDSSVAGPSREGWALCLAWTLEWSRRSAKEHIEFPDEGPFHLRWRELASLNCDAPSERIGYARLMKPIAEEADAPPFDMGIRILPGLVISNRGYYRWAAARGAIRLAEVTGLPASGSDILKFAIDVLSESEPEMAVRVLLRTLTYDADPILKRVLSRNRVATMSPDLVDSLAATCDGIIEYASRAAASGASGHSPFWLGRIRVAMEVLSRLVIRLEPDRVETAFNKALEYYGNNQIFGHHWLLNPIRSMLKRSWEALPEDRRSKRVLDILVAPIVGMEGFESSSENYPDPGELLQNEPPPFIRDNADERRWTEMVELLVRGLEAGGKARQRASIRIVSATVWNNLSQVEADAVAQALWKEPSDYLLPGNTLISDWMFLLLPEPKPGLAEQGFRRKWLMAGETSSGSTPSLDDVLWEVGFALFNLEKHGRSLHLSKDERSYLNDIVGKWLDAPIPAISRFSSFDQRVRATRNTILALPHIFSSVEFPQSIGEKLFPKLDSLNESKYPAYELVTGLAAILPERLEDIVSMMRVGLASEDSEIAGSATLGLHYWLRASSASASRLRAPPQDLVREIGVAIATRRKASLAQALNAAEWIFDKGGQEQQDAVREFALHGLGYLCQELRYDREPDQDNEGALPLLRWRSTQLALAMAKRGLEDNSNVVRWLAMAEDDPLPEIRYAKGFISSSQRDNGVAVRDQPNTAD